jgi:hypothetical protein
MTAVSSSPFTSRFDYGLASKVLVWLEIEIGRWAKSLELLDDNGLPLASTAVDFLDDLPENERVTIEIYASFNKNGFRTVVSQAVLMTRLQSIFSTYKAKKLRERLITAIRDVKFLGVIWD